MTERGPRSDEEALPFEVELERMPAWTQLASGLVVVVCVLVVLHVVPMLAVLPFLIVSSLGRRFATTPTHVEVTASEFRLGDRAVPRSAIVDVWVASERCEPLAAVALGEEARLAVLHFDNHVQAARFADSLAPAGGTLVLGHRARPLDLLPSVRFAALAAAFGATGSPYGLLVLGLFALGAWPVVQTKQIVTSARGFEVRTLFGTRAVLYEDVAAVDDAGTIELKAGAGIELPSSALRDVTLASPAWLAEARSRLLAAIRAASLQC